jgi:hypothetical protein
VVHADDDITSNCNDGTYICFVASTSCQICVVKGSHMNSVDDYLNNNVSFNTPLVCNMTSSERLYMHIKLFHCGWTCESDNIRYFYLLNKHHENHLSTVLKPEIVAIYDGTKEKIHQKNLHKNRSQNKKQIEDRKQTMAIRIMRKSPEKERLLEELNKKKSSSAIRNDYNKINCFDDEDNENEEDDGHSYESEDEDEIDDLKDGDYEP